MIYFHCPDFFNGFNIYQRINILLHDAPECFREDIQIGSIFGAIPGMIWNGGTFDLNVGVIDLNYYSYMADMYEGMGIPLKFTLTNGKLEPSDCYDRFCNKILEIFDNRNNEILINSPILEEYLRTKYPNYKFVKSITSTREDFDLNEALTQYDSIVLPKRHNKNFDLLNSVPEKNRDKIEILVNENCQPNCPIQYDHYLKYNDVQLYNIAPSQDTNCIYRRKIFQNYNHPNILLFDELKEKYYSIGYNQFKISGRGGPPNGINQVCSITPYLFKPDYQIEAINFLMS